MAFLEIKNIRKNFGKTGVLKGINIAIEKGEVVSVLGSSGSGKTTLLRCLNFLEAPDAGSITIDGKELFNTENRCPLTEKEIRENHLRFGLVFQSFNLFPQYSVLKNLTLAVELLEKKKPNGKSKEEINRRALSLLQKVGLSDRAAAYPCELSGGQQQRVAIARALMLDPDILCFDEPTSALDPELTGEVLKVIRALKDEGRTMIVVTHEMEFARHVSDKIIFMADGIVEAVGTPDEIFGGNASEKVQSFLGKARGDALGL